MTIVRGRAPLPVSVDRTGYRIGGRKYPRVTSILNCLAKPALTGWAAKSVAEYAVVHRDTWAKLPEADAIKLLKGSPWTQRDAAADRGSAIHNAIEAYLNGQPLPEMTEDELECAIAAEVFLRDHKPDVVGVEVTVYSPELDYAGTCDLPCTIGGEPWILDWKTGRSGVYGEYAVQLGAYAIAERAVLNGEDSPWHPWDRWPRLGVVHLKRSGYTLHEVVVDQSTLRETWRALRQLHHWMKEQDDALSVTTFPGAA